jgi:SAM-dependent methyltransferase
MKDLKQLVKSEFSNENAINLYIKKAQDGFFIGEKYMVEKYFLGKNTLSKRVPTDEQSKHIPTAENSKCVPAEKILDLGCGTGRTSIQLHKLGFDVAAIDFVPLMIEHAKKIALTMGHAPLSQDPLSQDPLSNTQLYYQVADACDLPFENESFDFALFSNQGHTQIPGKENRIKAMNEVNRVLKKDGIYIFSAHPRTTEFLWFWTKQWLRFYILKPLGFQIDEVDYGDRFFKRETTDTNTEKTFKDKQYIHIPTIAEVKKLILNSGFEILEINTQLQISEKDNQRKNPPVYYVCRKNN